MAKKFTFRFEPVLQLRKQKEQRSRERFAQARAAVYATAAEMQRFSEALRQASREAVATLAGHGQLAGEAGRIGAGVRAQAVCRARLTRQQRDADARREQLLDDMKNRSVLGRLKERLRARHQAQAGRAEARESGDLHAMYAARKNQAGSWAGQIGEEQA